MNILFIHGNYPGQFAALARATGADPRHRVVFLTGRQDPENRPIAGVEVRPFARTRDASPHTHHYLQVSETLVLDGQAVLRGLMALAEEGFRPDLVICHGGNGLGLFIQDLYPQVPVVGLFEWWFRPETSRWLFADFPLDTQLKLGLRNLVIQQELARCTAAVTPTAWQQQQFPAPWRSRLRVVFDGINTSFFHPAPAGTSRAVSIQGLEQAQPLQIPAEAKVLSYATRGMEPLRGFPEFMASLPALLAADPSLQVVIAGEDRVAYSYPPPDHGGSWKRHCLAQWGSAAEQHLLLQRVHFTGSLSYGDYRALLWRSDCHCSFSRPYVISWSLFEAVACATRLLVSDTPALRSAIPAAAAQWVDLDDPAAVGAAIARRLNDPQRPAVALPDHLQENSCLKGWTAVVQDALAQARAAVGAAGQPPSGGKQA